MAGQSMVQWQLCRGDGMVRHSGLKIRGPCAVRVRLPPSVHYFPMIHWDIYEISSRKHSLNGVMLRGRIRKFGLQNEVDILVENTADRDNGVRFGLLTGTSVDDVQNYIQSIVSDAHVNLVLESIKNPVLSKLKVNEEERYTL